MPGHKTPVGITPQLELTLRNRQAEIGRLQDALEELAATHGLADRTLHELQLAVEEHLANILKHAYEDDSEHRIAVRFSFPPSKLQIEIEDDGRPFNPLDHPAPDLSVPLDERPIGGLGIHMMRKSLDGLVYRRTDGKNVLTMVKRIRPA